MFLIYSIRTFTERRDLLQKIESDNDCLSFVTELNFFRLYLKMNEESSLHYLMEQLIICFDALITHFLSIFSRWPA